MNHPLPRRELLLLLLCSAILLTFLSCATGSSSKEGPTGQAQVTPAGEVLFKSARCSPTGPCTCRNLADSSAMLETSSPVPPARRFEFRIQGDTPTALRVVYLDWADRPPLTLQTGPFDGEVCYYLDLPPGRHHIELRTRETLPGRGIVTGLEVSEYRHQGPYWYRALKHFCGHSEGERCSKKVMRAWKDELLMERKKFQDPCGSARVEKMQWDGVSVGRIYQDILFEFDLVVARVPPKNPPCREK